MKRALVMLVAFGIFGSCLANPTDSSNFTDTLETSAKVFSVTRTFHLSKLPLLEKCRENLNEYLSISVNGYKSQLTGDGTLVHCYINSPLPDKLPRYGLILAGEGNEVRKNYTFQNGKETYNSQVRIAALNSNRLEIHIWMYPYAFQKGDSFRDSTLKIAMAQLEKAIKEYEAEQTAVFYTIAYVQTGALPSLPRLARSTEDERSKRLFSTFDKADSFER